MAFRSEDRVCYEFDDFFVDPIRRVLLRGDVPVQVSPKALSILVALLAQPGETVDKADLIEKVWGATQVSEANLTQNVFALRKILGEKANESRYVVTVPGRGYSFAGEVRRIERAATGVFPLVSIPPASPPPAPASAVALAMEAPPTVTQAPTVPAAASPNPPPETIARRRWHLGPWGALLALGLLGAGLLGFLQIHFRRGPAAASLAMAKARPSIVVLDFRSLSPKAESAWLQSALPTMLATELAAGGKLRILRGETVTQVQRSLSFQEDGSLRRGDLERLHAVLGANRVVLGTYLPIGDKIRLDLHVVRIPEADTLISVAEEGTESGLFDLVSRSGRHLRESLGLAALSPEQARQARALQPKNGETTRLYNEGLLRLRAFDPPGALALLQKAAEADAGSAVIHSALSQSWSGLGYDAQAEAEARKASELAASLSREERLAIEARLHQVSKKWDRAAETYGSLWTFFPDEIEYGLQLADSQTAGGHGTEAAATLAVLRRLPPPAGHDPRIDIAESRNAGRLSDFATELRAAANAVAKGRKSGQTLVVSRALVYQGFALEKMGRTQEALGLFRESRDLAQKAGHQWQVGMALANLAFASKSLGDLDGAEKADQEALAIAQRTGSGVGIAYELYALAELHRERGELAKARRLFEESQHWTVEIGDRVGQTKILDRLGEILCAQGDLAGARERLEEALRIGQAMANAAVEAESLDGLGSILALQGDLAGARSRHEQAFVIFHRVGDSDLAASALVALADVEARLGELHTASQHSNQALLARRQAGDRLGTAVILGFRARLAYSQGDLAKARELGADQLRLARETGARVLAAGALQNRGRTDLAAGDLDGARKSLQEAFDIASSLGGSLQATEIHLDLARLALAAGRPAEASKLAREVASWYRERKIDGREALALAVLSEALLAQGARVEAAQAAVEARSRLGTSGDVTLRLEMAAPLARIAAVSGHTAEALRDLRQAIADAERTGLVASGLEARLALAQIQREMKDPAGEILLAAVRRDAETRGFRRLAALAAPQASRPLG
ncbi:MAG TPA: tetratricopeptide repeat protein [Thermoanaerobaculia bacterium]|jgi:DNA-binding winged helix-turn-helix (wHTH) protein/tetratricopeptide (TPR) repeat protein|nr:tetratricopeptide repeat protein [Thermoanaerobaculia bacterium]